MSVENNALICPVCASPLTQSEKTYHCANNHSFDKAKQGYVNLLLSNQKKTQQPGDNKEMVKSRIDFLKKDYYLPIVTALNEAIQQKLAKLQRPNPNIVDLGCGVGYYLSHLRNALLSSFPGACYWGTDISKEAIHCANQHDKAISWIVSSNKNLPFASESIDIALSVFSPLYHDEVKRILSPNGLLFAVTPAKNHLMELREYLFDELKEIDEDKLLLKTDGFFEFSESLPIQSSMTLESKEEIENLLKMTPFYWRSSAFKKDMLLSLDKLKVSIDVMLWVFKPE